MKMGDKAKADQLAQEMSRSLFAQLNRLNYGSQGKAKALGYKTIMYVACIPSA